MECTQSAADYWRELYESTAVDVNPPDQGSELGRDYYWVEDAS